MAKLSSFKRNVSSAAKNGEWVRLGDAYDDLEILSRGFWDEYTDARNLAVRNLSVRRYKGDAFKITTAENRDIVVDCLADKVLMNVRGIVDDNGQDVPLAAFIGFLRDPDYSELYNAVCNACGNVGAVKALDNEDDVKNS